MPLVFIYIKIFVFISVLTPPDTFKMKALRSFKTSGTTDRTTHCHTPEDGSHLQSTCFDIPNLE